MGTLGALEQFLQYVWDDSNSNLAVCDYTTNDQNNHFRWKIMYSGYQNKWNVEMHKSENQLFLFGYQWSKNDLYLILKP